MKQSEEQISFSFCSLWWEIDDSSLSKEKRSKKGLHFHHHLNISNKHRRNITKRRIEIYFLISTQFSHVSMRRRMDHFGGWKWCELRGMKNLPICSNINFQIIHFLYITLVRHTNPPSSVEINFSFLLSKGALKSDVNKLFFENSACRQRWLW